MNQLLQDLRYSLRTFVKDAGFTTIVVITLALCIGANTAIFSALHAVLIRDLPYRHGGRIVRIDEIGERGGIGVSPPNFRDFQERNRSFERIGAYSGGSFVLSGSKEPLRVEAASITADVFGVLGVAPQLGRIFWPEHESAGAERVAVIGHGLWQRVFGSDPGIAGRQIVLDEKTFTVVGVMPRGFEFPIQPVPVEVWTPLVLPADMSNLRGAHYLDLVGLLKAGITPAAARADLEVTTRRLAVEFPGKVPGQVSVAPLKEDVVGTSRKPLLVLAAAVGFVLLIGSANISNLLLGRAARRRQEIAVRAALGAAPGRLARQFLTESVVVALIGGAAGLLVAAWLQTVIVQLSPAEVPRLHDLRLNMPALAFALAASLMSGLLVGVAPALSGWRTSVQRALQRGDSRVRGRRPVRRWIVAGEMTLAVILLAAAALMIRTLGKLHAVDPGFDPKNLLVAEVILPAGKYAQPEQQRLFFEQLVERARALPGVDFAAGTSNLPMTGSNMVFMVWRKERKDVSGPASFRSITFDYFRTMRIPLLRGRAFIAADDHNAAPVAVISQAMADRFFPGEDPIGKRIHHGFSGADAQIVGIVGNVRHAGPHTDPRPELYVPFAQRPFPFLRIAARTTSDPVALGTLLRRQVFALDANQPTDKVAAMEHVLRASVAERRFYMLLLGGFSGLALLLAATGIYGVVSQAVTERVREIGVRMALGADRRAVLGLMLVDGMKPVVVGMATGLAGAAAGTRVLRRLLFGVQPLDALAFAGAAATLMAVALLASYIPARRAAAVDPMIALRYE